VKRLHAPAANAPPNRLFDNTKRPIDSALESGVLSSHDDARQSPEDHFDQAYFVGPTAWSVHVANTDADALDGPRELREFRTQLATDVGLVIVVELDAEHPHVDRRLDRVSVVESWLFFDHDDRVCSWRASADAFSDRRTESMARLRIVVAHAVAAADREFSGAAGRDLGAVRLHAACGETLNPCSFRLSRRLSC
jgi:hypothetical protein